MDVGTVGAALGDGTVGTTVAVGVRVVVAVIVAVPVAVAVGVGVPDVERLTEGSASTRRRAFTQSTFNGAELAYRFAISPISGRFSVALYTGVPSINQRPTFEFQSIVYVCHSVNPVLGSSNAMLFVGAPVARTRAASPAAELSKTIMLLAFVGVSFHPHQAFPSVVPSCIRISNSVFVYGVRLRILAPLGSWSRLLATWTAPVVTCQRESFNVPPSKSSQSAYTFERSVGGAPAARFP